MVVEAGARRIARGLLLAGLLLGAALGAAEPLSADRQAGVNALHQAFVQQRDLWSALQIESYARARGYALPPVLGDARIIGEPLFAFPQFIDDVWEGGSWMVVRAAERIYFLSSDGCPILTSRPTSAAPLRMAMSRYGRHLGTLTRRDQGPWTVTVTRLLDMTEVLRCDVAARPGDGWAGELHLSDDGSAVTFYVTNRGADGHDAVRQAWIDARGAQVVDESIGVIGVGAGCAWQAVWNGALRRSELRRPGAAPEAFSVMACGGGCAVGASADGLAIGRPDGSVARVPAPFTLGRWPRLVSAGGWLAVTSDFDLAGPGRTALYRWSELGADPLAPPARIINGRCGESLRDPGALWLWSGRAFATIDCSRPESPRITALGEAPDAITGVTDAMDRALVATPGALLVCDPDGTELWRGRSDGHTLICKELLVVRTAADRPRVTMVRLERDPARRRSGALDLPADGREWEVAYDRTDDLVVARSGADWRQFDPQTGASVARAAPGQPPPAFDRVQERSGRRVKDLSRLVPRGTSREPWAEHLLTKDAWPFGGDLMVATSYYHVLDLAPDGGWSDLGYAPDSTRFNLDPRGRLVISSHTGQGLHAIERGADGRARFAAGAPGPASEPPGDPWQLGPDLSFTPPGGKAMRWDDAVGFRPIVVRAPPGRGLMAITESVVIELGPAQAALVGRPAGAP